MKFIINDPVDYKLLSNFFKDDDLLKLAWPNAIAPFSKKQWSSWFKLDPELTTLSTLLIDKDLPIAHAALKKYKKHPGISYLCLVAVKKEYQSKGHGKNLIKQFLSYCHKTLGINEIYLMVYPDNKRALDFYRSLGFQWVDGKIPMRLKINLRQP